MVTKPFSPRELLARIKQFSGGPDKLITALITIGSVILKSILKNTAPPKMAKPLSLTALEYALLRLFMSHPDEVLSRDFILNEIWEKMCW